MRKYTIDELEKKPPEWFSKQQRLDDVMTMYVIAEYRKDTELTSRLDRIFERFINWYERQE